MSKYNYPDKCREISGFGGDYEKKCRVMVSAGMRWLDENKDASPRFAQDKNITGMTFNENDDMLHLQSYMASAVDNDCTGAMMHACSNHVFYAHKNGWDSYIKEMEARDE